jgi:hypothetical protein
MDEVSERLGAIAGALDAADAALARARARNVPRTRLPASIARLGALGRMILRAYNALFIVQREIAADQTDALVAVVNAMREIVRSQQALHRTIDPPPS